MQKASFGKNIKFAMLLSFSIAAGIQVSHAADVYCPTELEGMDKTSKNIWTLTAFTTGAEKIAMKGVARVTTRRPDLEDLDGTLSHGNDIICSYGGAEIALTGKFKTCTAVDKDGHPVEAGTHGTHFDCTTEKNK